MILAKKKTLTAVIVCGFIVLSQNVFSQESGNILINSDPQGSLVRLIGELTLSGVTPVRFDQPLSGQYRIEVIREGYEKYSSVAYFSETQASQVDITLVPKTRAKAFIRSVIIPGWGQKYYGDRTKSTLFFLGTAVSVAGYVFAKDDYDSKTDDYNARKAAYDEETLWSELPRLEAEMMEAQRRADDAEDMVNVMTVVTAGIYLFNVLDSFLFFPEFNKYTEYKAITVRPDFGSDEVGVALSFSF
jgi:hypothetical protein